MKFKVLFLLTLTFMISLSIHAQRGVRIAYIISEIIHFSEQPIGSDHKVGKYLYTRNYNNKLNMALSDWPGCLANPSNHFFD